MALKMAVRCRIREGPPNSKCSVSVSSGPCALSGTSASIALATSPVDTIMSSSPGGMEGM